MRYMVEDVDLDFKNIILYFFWYLKKKTQYNIM